MVQKLTKSADKPRGRPRSYDPQKALKLATDVFWKSGYAGSSVDEIAAATGMNKPSLYAAFGDKHGLYVEALSQYWRVTFETTREALAPDGPLKDALLRAFETAISVYFSGEGRARGCFVIGTAVTEAREDRDIRASLLAGLKALDQVFEHRIRLALEKGELRKDADCQALAMSASATMHTIAIRARAGMPREALQDFARKSAGMICR